MVGKIRLTDINSIRPHPKNPRVGDIDAIRESIRENGWHGVVVVQTSTNRIVVGRHRWEAAKLEGLKKIPVEFKDMSDAVALRVIAVDNRTSDLASYDDTALASLLVGLRDTDQLIGSGFESADVDDLLARAEAAAATKPSPARDESDLLIPQWAIVVTCAGEAEQLALLARFAGEGLSVRAIVG